MCYIVTHPLVGGPTNDWSSSCVSLNNQTCKARPTLVNINSDETLFYPFTVTVNKCGGSFITTDDSYSRVCVSNKLKNLNLKYII